MSEELKPCPFCGHPAKIVWQSPRYRAVACINDECPVGPEGDADPYCLTLDEWNHRPIEDALRARVVELQGRLSDMADDRDELKVCVQELKAERDRLRADLQAVEEEEKP